LDATDEQKGIGFPPRIADGVQVAVEKTFSVICGEKPVLHALDEATMSAPCMATVISFIGDVPWSFTLVFPPQTAPALALRYFGVEVPFESADMGDVVGELGNVLAGEVIAQLEQRGIRVQMSLPTVARGNHLEFIPNKAGGIVRLDYMSREGPFWLRLMAVSSKLYPVRFPGRQSEAQNGGGRHSG
jgi:chemotaxis protein CheX